MKKYLAILLFFTTLSVTQPIEAEDNFPKKGSLKRTEVNVRAGPGTRYPILWVFQRKDWPISLLAKYDNWIKIKDLEGEEGWAYVGMVSSKETAIISPGAPVFLRKKPQEKPAIYRLSENVIVSIEKCEADSQFCQVSYNGKIGWLEKKRLSQPSIK